uniref:C-type lectin domain-containing protein n=1 Tax=Cricetulus griseus TaxID=10029 RepID=A0A8C2MAQ6_CRIGR
MSRHLALNTVDWMLLSCLMFLSQMQGEDSQKELPSPWISCSMGSKAYHSDCYALYQADLACQKRHYGHLVSILPGAETSFVSSMVNDRVNNYQDIWIGLRDPTMNPMDYGWEWRDSVVLNNFNWDGNPSYVVNCGHCGTLRATSGFLKWGDHHCDGQLPFVCKFKE